MSKHFSMRLTTAELAWIEAEAKRTGKPAAAVVRDALVAAREGQEIVSRLDKIAADLDALGRRFWLLEQSIKKSGDQ